METLHLNPHASSSTEPVVRIRCPHCFQTFKSFKKEFIQEYHDFECSICEKEFWIDSKKAQGLILGNKPNIEKKRKTEPVKGLGVTTKVCPRCTEEVSIEDQECSYCGVVFIKMIEGIGSSFELRGQWAEVVKRWHDDSIHDQFLNTCRVENELVYGISCYGRILKTDKGNKKAKEMIKRLEALTWFFEEESPKPSDLFRKTFLEKVRLWCKSYSFDAFLLAILGVVIIYIFS